MKVVAYAGRHRAAPPARHKVVARKTVHKKTTRKVIRKTPRNSTGLSRVVSFAWSKVGHSYGGQWDCSGFVQKAYAQIGINLPHSSGAIAGRARPVSRSQARPGDIVVGPGHVGIYMGGGMMIDAGNSRVGISYRPMYAGLHVERLT